MKRERKGCKAAQNLFENNNHLEIRINVLRIIIDRAMAVGLTMESSGTPEPG
jgi:hypothetical protein